MSRLLPSLCLLLLPGLSLADAGHGDVASLQAHHHGVAELNLAIEGDLLELELHSPAINLLGFEHTPIDPQQRAALKRLRDELASPAALLGLPPQCELLEQQLHSPLLEISGQEQRGHQGEQHGHADLLARYRYRCAPPPAGLDLAGLFARFPELQRLDVQLVTEQAQRGLSLDATAAELSW